MSATLGDDVIALKKMILHNAVSILHNAVSVLHNAVSILHNAVSILHNAVSIPGFYRTQYPASYTHKSLGRTRQFTLPACAGTQMCLLCLSS